jgi:hypothetical protein
VLTSDEQAHLVDALRAVSVSRDTPPICPSDQPTSAVTRRTADVRQSYVTCGSDSGAGSVSGDLATAFKTARSLVR